MIIFLLLHFRSEFETSKRITRKQRQTENFFFLNSWKTECLSLWRQHWWSIQNIKSRLRLWILCTGLTTTAHAWEVYVVYMYTKLLITKLSMLMLERQAEFLSPFKLLCTIRARMLGWAISATYEAYILFIRTITKCGNIIKVQLGTIYKKYRFVPRNFAKKHLIFQLMIYSNKEMIMLGEYLAYKLYAWKAVCSIPRNVLGEKFRKKRRGYMC